MGRIIGIDLGTTNTVMAIFDRGERRILPNRFGHRVTPSVVRLLPGGGAVVGTEAQRLRTLDPQNTVAGIKRFIGRYYNEVMDLREAVPFHVASGAGGRAVVRAHGREYSPEWISAMILRDVKESAEQQLGESISEAVITVPAHFSDSQREATRYAGKLAGFDVKRLVVEPTAAALGYAVGIVEEHVAVVIDLGGGTFDVSVLEVGDTVCQAISVAGDTNLGGDDFDDVLLQWVVQEIHAEHAFDVSSSPEALQHVREAVIAAKCELSFREQTTLSIPHLAPEGSAPIHVTLPITRDQLEHLADELLARLEEPIRRALRDARKSPADIHRVLLVGGASRMPCVLARTRGIFGTRPRFGLNLEEAVALGAATQASVIAGDIKDLVLLDVTDASLGIEVEEGQTVRMIRRNTTIPTQKKEVFTTTIDNQTSVEIHLLRGDHARTLDNRTLARVKLDGIAPAPKGAARIMVTLEIDANHHTKLIATDSATGREVTAEITSWVPDRQDASSVLSSGSPTSPAEPRGALKRIA